MIEQADIVMIDKDSANLAIVSKLIPDSDLVILQKFDGKSANRTFIRAARLTVVQSASEARKRGRNKI